MKKMTKCSISIALAAVLGAAVAGYFYIKKRERELDEYENLLFSDEFSDDLEDEDLADVEEIEF